MLKPDKFHTMSAKEIIGVQEILISAFRQAGSERMRLVKQAQKTHRENLKVANRFHSERVFRAGNNRHKLRRAASLVQLGFRIGELREDPVILSGEVIEETEPPVDLLMRYYEEVQRRHNRLKSTLSEFTGKSFQGSLRLILLIATLIAAALSIIWFSGLLLRAAFYTFTILLDLTGRIEIVWLRQIVSIIIGSVGTGTMIFLLGGSAFFFFRRYFSTEAKRAEVKKRAEKAFRDLTGLSLEHQEGQALSVLLRRMWGLAWLHLRLKAGL